MSKKKNDVFEYEKQWQLFKGNEYMYRLLSRMSPKVECNCPKSYLYYQKMSKNHMQDLTKKHEVMLQNRILKKKLQNSKSTIKKHSNISLIKNNVSRSQRSLNKALEESQIIWENTNMFKRISNSKSFFSTVKCYSSVGIDNSNSNSKRNKPKSRVPLQRNICNNSYFIMKNQQARDATGNKDSSISMNNNNNNSSNSTNKKVFPDISNNSRNAFFDYNELAYELMKTNSDVLLLYKKNRFISNIGLVSIKIQFQMNQLIITLEPILFSIPNMYTITFGDESNLSQIPLLFKSYDDIVSSLKYIKDEFVLAKNFKELSYITHTKPKENTALIK